LAETIEKAINQSLGRASSVASAASGQLIIAKMEGDVCRISIDSSGELLHRRGYRLQTAQAPLRETLAAGILKLLDWEGETPLVDPMCGSGTFATEAALIASRRPAGEARQFAFMDWPRFRPGLWSLLVEEGQRQSVIPTVAIHGSDAAATAVAAAEKNLEQAGCDGLVALDCRKIDAVEGLPGPGLIICNPPYGLRIGKNEDLVPLYRQIGAVYKKQFSGWKGAMLCPPGRLADATGLNLKRVAALLNGGLKVTLFEVEL
jgi:putative N6-adenine-specific DNA methylase